MPTLHLPPRPLVLVLAALALGCPHDDPIPEDPSSGLTTGAPPDSGTTTAATTGEATEPTTGGTGGSSGSTGLDTDGLYHVSGVLSFELVPYGGDDTGLDYGAVVTRPIRNVAVHLLDAATDAEIATTVAAEDGSYSFAYEGPARVKLWIYSETTDPVITVEDNTDGNAVYVLQSEEVDSGGDVTLDFLARTGWDGSAYAGPRAAAPFAVLDAAYTAALLFRAGVAEPPAYPPLKINWSVDNRPEDGEIEDGGIGTSYWDGQEIYVLGQADVDTDEFDGDVIVHEWGHYFESNVTRSESPGGSHQYADILDPRAAWSEGFASSLTAIAWLPDTVYSDCGGPGQGEGFSWDVETNEIDGESNAGWYSEWTVQSVLFDLFDPANEPFDGVEIGLQGVYDALLLGVRDTPALTTLFGFLAAAKTLNPGLVDDLDATITYNSVDETFGISPVADEWGTGETHFANLESLPVYGDLVVDDPPIMATFIGGAFFNALAQNRYYRFTGDGSMITIETTCPGDIDIYVWSTGELIDYAETFTGDEMVQFPTNDQQVYVLAVQGWHDVEGPYVADIVIKH